MAEDPAPLASGIERLRAALSDRYRIERELGAGGMATVYLAHDLKHDRDVAIKVLRADLAAVIGAERFLAEIKTTANLQHPHILSLFDSGEVGGTVFYVMPYVAGESLRDRLSHAKQLPVEEAIRVAREVADALSYAHAHGVIHRDIKPENILLHGGHALVADFGIALAVSRTDGGSRMTETGMSLGTPHYMSPEQAMGEREIAPSADIYALACVLYEMLTGEPPFTGPTAQSIVAKLLTSEPTPVSTLRKTVPPHVDAALETALQKLPADRFESAASFSEALGGTQSFPMRSRMTGATPVMLARRRRLLTYAPWVLVIAAFGVGVLARSKPLQDDVAQFAVAFSANEAPSFSMLGTHIAVSRDGKLLVYCGGDSVGGRLAVKRIDELAATVLAGTESAYDPFISPDGQQIGFTSDRDGRALKVVSLSGGPARVVAGPPLGTSGAVWATDGYIYFDSDANGIDRIRPDGTGRETVIPLDTARHEIGFAWPQMLPDNKTLIMRLRHNADGAPDFSIIAYRIDKKERAVLTRAVSAAYADGMLFTVTSDGSLQAGAFDARRLKLADPVNVASGLRVYGTYAGVDIVASDDGTLYYVSGTSGAASQLLWLSRDGKMQPVDPTWRETGEIRSLALSPDGTRAALELTRAGASGTDIWVKQLPNGPLTRLTVDPAPDTRPAWSADGRSILFISERVSPGGVFRRAADGTGSDVFIGKVDRPIMEVAESPDGKWLLARTSSGYTGQGDILAMELGRDTVFRPIIATPAAEQSPTLSPDGRWLLYVSLASGRREVYVRPFPNVNGGLWQVSTNGAMEPRWSRSGKEIYFRDISSLDLVAVDVQTQPVFQAGVPHSLMHLEAATGFDHTRYDVARDDSRFLVTGYGGHYVEPQLVRVENLIGTLRRKVR